MNLTLKVWRQKNSKAPGRFVEYQAKNIIPDMSFLEMLDVVNEEIARTGVRNRLRSITIVAKASAAPVLGRVIDGKPHGRQQRHRAVCEPYMHQFQGRRPLVVELFRAKAFPLIKDLVVDRKAFDRIIQHAGGLSTSAPAAAPDANSIPVPKENADLAMDAAPCIGCGACVAACKNASAMLFVAAKISHLGLLPQGQPERYRRAFNMVKAMDEAGFGSCTNTNSCEAVCPKEISVEFIARLNRDYAVALLRGSGQETGSSRD